RASAARGAEGRRTDRVHDHFADRVAGCGADPAVIHGRYRRPIVSRVRGDPFDYHSDVGDRIADADADDVLETAEAYAGIPAGAVLPVVGKGLGDDHRMV